MSVVLKEFILFAVVFQQIFIGMMSKLFPLILNKNDREREGSPRLKEQLRAGHSRDGPSQETASRLAWLGRAVQLRGKARMTIEAQVTEDMDCPCNKEFEDRNKRLWKIF